MAIALFPGSFDPFTLGHADIVERGLKIFEKIIIAIGHNEHKRGMQSEEERCATIRNFYPDGNRVEIKRYTGLTVDFARKTGADCILRGARNSLDFEFERNLADTNRELTGVETVILISRPELSFISSSMVRELIHNGYDVSRFLPHTP